MGACCSRMSASSTSAARGTGRRLPAIPGEAEAARKPLSPRKKEEDTSLQHISDREDLGAAEKKLLETILPSSTRVSPSVRRSSTPASPLKKSFSEIAESQASRESLRNSKKFNSTSTLFVDSTASAPNLEETLQCVAAAIYLMITDGHTVEHPQLYSNKFDEARFPLSDAPVPRDYMRRIPSEGDIYHFLERMFKAAVLAAESAIITLVYINRAIVYTELALHASNWKRVVLGAVLMASKVWDDQAVWNVDFCKIFPRISVEDMNDLECTYLEMLQFNMNVDSAVYTKYYFDLRELAETNHKVFSLEPLSIEGAARLQALSAKRQATVKEAGMRSAKSLDARTFSAKAVIN
eukprot:m.234614 g.234614  ORF g.234614 m.234614 type:complete len:352 (-) comp12688_c0_seq1:149-1204(-)